MAWGGARPGAGRPKGSRDRTIRKSTTRIQRATEAATKFLPKTEKAQFERDPLALLMWGYKNADLPIEVRMQCAIAAIRYEKPRLTSTRVPMRRLVDMTDEELAATIAEARAEAAALRQNRGGSRPKGTQTKD
jgi:hypothetical protein